MPNVLVVEDSRTFAGLLRKRIEQDLGFDVTWAPSRRAAEDILARRPGEFFMALLDVNLPDAPGGEIVDTVLSLGIPALVFTGEMGDSLREGMWAKRIVDYVHKDRPESVDYVVGVVRRIHRNAGIKVLVVDDSPSVRRHIAALLDTHRFTVLEAGEGNAALALLAANPDLTLMVVDRQMPGMDGLELVRAVRRTHRKEDLAIIGVSAQGGGAASVHFIKSGANDFLHKPFLTEEFYCRVSQNVEMIEYIRQIEDLSNKDFLTRLFNRRYFFETAGKLHALSVRQGTALSVAMMDIDFFKRINDGFGHDAGDEVLRHLAGLLSARFRTTDIVARFGGEEFCVLAPGLDREAARELFESLRAQVEGTVVEVAGQAIRFTVSVGVCCDLRDTLEAMITEADNLLYEAKRGGRNQVRVRPGGGT